MDTIISRLTEAMQARRAHYPGNNFYGLVHETAHGFDLGLPDAEPVSIATAIGEYPERERMMFEVVAKATARRVCRIVGYPLFPDSIAYAARSVLGFAQRRGEIVRWSVQDFVEASLEMERSERVDRLVLLTLGLLDRE